VKESDSAPDFAEAIQAWRAWRVVSRGGFLLLCSVVQKTLWPPNEVFRAECLRTPTMLQRLRRRHLHEAPGRWCECGIYGTSIHQVGHYLTEAPRTGVGRVFGSVSLWDTVIECERGYRAGCAYPARIYVPADAGNTASHDADVLVAGLEHYGVPVEKLAEQSRAAVLTVAQLMAA
jgi:hypothetical protein